MKQSTQKQFAVLYLSFSKEDLLEPNFINNKGITDNNKKLFPLDDGLSSYVTARPHKDLPMFKGHNAEELIAGKFAKLVEAYKKEKKRNPVHCPLHVAVSLQGLCCRHHF